ncbi:MAG: TetR/AcrR family transcriptional regulator [Chthoniobacterales bacterium]
MNERSFIVLVNMPPNNGANGEDRPTQILRAAILCFAQRGFHQTSMHDISAEAGISVGLIYRYFRSKEAVIAALAEQYKTEIGALLERARRAPTLLESLEILFTAHCCEDSPKLHSAFVVDLYAEAARNPQVADLVRDILQTAMDGVTDLIARSPEAQQTGPSLEPHEIAELIFAVARGMLMRDILQPPDMTAAERRDRQLAVTRRLWRLIFENANEPALA